LIQNEWQQYNNEKKGNDKISKTRMIHKKDLGKVWGYNCPANGVP
jgi:hypothetical protein